jgi:hypothetical protein
LEKVGLAEYKELLTGAQVSSCIISSAWNEFYNINDFSDSELIINYNLIQGKTQGRFFLIKKYNLRFINLVK